MSLKALPTSTQGFIKGVQTPRQENPKPKEKEICPICREDLEDRVKITACKHLFHPDCLATWLKNHRICPTCRYELIPPPAKSPEEVDSDREIPNASGLIFAIAFIFIRTFYEEAFLVHIAF